MDPLSLTASIIAVLQLSATVVQYLNTAADAGSQKSRLHNEITSCEALLKEIRKNTSGPKAPVDGPDAIREQEATTIREQEIKNGPLEELKNALTLLKAKLEPRKGLRNALDVLKWPLEEKGVEKILSSIERQKSLLQLAVAVDSR